MRILTGIQSSGKPHLGNLLGAILPAVELSKDPKNEAFFFYCRFAFAHYNKRCPSSPK